jgi:two-component system, NtrC family, response regulator HupR/HoxA
MMGKWTKILESHVVNVFRNTCNVIWGMDVHFYDEFSNYINDGVPFRNPLCSLIHSKTQPAKDCLLFRRKVLKGFNKYHKTFDCIHCENLRGIVVPIIAAGDYVGAMMCLGMQFPTNNDQKKKSIIKLTKLGFDKTEVETCYNRIKIATSHTEEYVLALMKLVAEDVAEFYETLSGKENTKKKQTLLLSMNYNEKYKSIIGKSPAIKDIFDTLELIKSAENPVLLEGETGTGKELLAAAIHYNSPRKDEAFIIQNCSAFHDTLLCSELFGHVKGSFTGAVSEKKGLFEIADGGTIFLDEIGDMKMEIQSKLLRILEDGTFYRVGGTEHKKVDVRIIAATNQELKKQVEQGLFRKDLFYRINAITINIPPLRERREDVMPLANFFLEPYAENRNEESKHLSHEVIERLEAYNWPGNIRELKNLIERLVVLSGKNNTIEVNLLPGEMMDVSPGLLAGNNENGTTLRDSLQSLEKKLTGDALKRMKWNKTLASRELGISRASLNNKIARFDIHPTTS